MKVKLLRDIWVSRNGKRRGCFSAFFWREKPRGKGMGGLGGLLIQRKEGTCQLHVEDEDTHPCVTTAEPETVYNSWEARV